MRLRTLGRTNINVAPLILGGNVFGWTCDRSVSYALLDRFLDAGFNAIDTADWYTRSAPGLKGGESEGIIGDWMADRRARNRIVIISKAGLEMGAGMEGLGRSYLPEACQASLRRLRTDRIDVYMAHRPDPLVPIDETLGAFQQLIDIGWIGHAGCSNYSADELEEALRSSGQGRALYSVVEPHYNLYDRTAYEGRVEKLCSSHGAGVIAYYALASGFLTGKYRSESDLHGRTSRLKMLSTYFTPRGTRLLEVLYDIAARHRATPAQISLAWIMARSSVTAPIASATSVAQLEEILGAAHISLDVQEIDELASV